jgi:adenylate kinase
MEMQTIIFIGPQGSGKGTQVERLLAWWPSVSNTPISLIETGKPFRHIAAEGGFLADLIKERIEHGQLVPNVVTNALFTREVLHQVTATTALILDGFPRDIEQVEVLNNLLVFLKRPNIIVIHLDTTEEVVVERMMSRGRSDDTPSAISQRLALYNEVTAPVLSYYRTRPQTNIISVDGSLTIDDVASDIAAKLAPLIS